MKNIYLIKTSVLVSLLVFFFNNLFAQCHYIPSTSTAIDTLSYTFSGGSFSSFGCAPIDPTYWMAGNGDYFTVNFVNSQSYPTFRVWGMNDDDSASVAINGSGYPLTSSTASYSPKVICGLSPGPDGVIFSGGNLVGANSNTLGNYSYQDVQLNAINVSSFTVTGLSGAGWGFAGVSVNCPLNPSGITEIVNNSLVSVYPNPGRGEIKIKSLKTIDEFNITDLSGRTIYTMKPDGNAISINLDTPGIYFITAVSGKQIVKNKLVVSK